MEPCYTRSYRQLDLPGRVAKKTVNRRIFDELLGTCCEINIKVGIFSIILQKFSCIHEITIYLEFSNP